MKRALKSKLKELVYTKLDICDNLFLYEKSIFNPVTICIRTNKKCTKIIDFEVDGNRFIDKQSQLDENQKAFDTMKKDLEVLKEYEKE